MQFKTSKNKGLFCSIYGECLWAGIGLVWSFGAKVKQKKNSHRKLVHTIDPKRFQSPWIWKIHFTVEFIAIRRQMLDYKNVCFIANLYIESKCNKNTSNKLFFDSWIPNKDIFNRNLKKRHSFRCVAFIVSAYQCQISIKGLTQVLPSI